ncbi:Adenylate cyclase [Diplonema papillatum]|nr:Adenylate cyclase [Diplonema papillatum]
MGNRGEEGKRELTCMVASQDEADAEAPGLIASSKSRTQRQSVQWEDNDTTTAKTRPVPRRASFSNDAIEAHITRGSTGDTSPRYPGASRGMSLRCKTWDNKPPYHPSLNLTTSGLAAHAAERFRKSKIRSHLRAGFWVTRCVAKLARSVEKSKHAAPGSPVHRGRRKTTEIEERGVRNRTEARAALQHVMGVTEVMRALHEHPVNIAKLAGLITPVSASIADSEGNNPLHWVVSMATTGVGTNIDYTTLEAALRCVLEKGGNLYAANNAGLTPLTLLKAFDVAYSDSVLRILKRYGMEILSKQRLLVSRTFSAALRAPGGVGGCLVPSTVHARVFYLLQLGKIYYYDFTSVPSEPPDEAGSRASESPRSRFGAGVGLKAEGHRLVLLFDPEAHEAAGDLVTNIRVKAFPSLHREIYHKKEWIFCNTGAVLKLGFRKDETGQPRHSYTAWAPPRGKKKPPSSDPIPSSAETTPSSLAQPLEDDDDEWRSQSEGYSGEETESRSISTSTAGTGDTPKRAGRRGCWESHENDSGEDSETVVKEGMWLNCDHLSFVTTTGTTAELASREQLRKSLLVHMQEQRSSINALSGNAHFDVFCHRGLFCIAVVQDYAADAVSTVQGSPLQFPPAALQSACESDSDAAEDECEALLSNMSRFSMPNMSMASGFAESPLGFSLRVSVYSTADHPDADLLMEKLTNEPWADLNVEHRAERHLVRRPVSLSASSTQSFFVCVPHALENDGVIVWSAERYRDQTRDAPPPPDDGKPPDAFSAFCDEGGTPAVSAPARGHASFRSQGGGWDENRTEREALSFSGSTERGDGGAASEFVSLGKAGVAGCSGAVCFGQLFATVADAVEVHDASRVSADHSSACSPAASAARRHQPPAAARPPSSLLLRVEPDGVPNERFAAAFDQEGRLVVLRSTLVARDLSVIAVDGGVSFLCRLDYHNTEGEHRPVRQGPDVSPAVNRLSFSADYRWLIRHNVSLGTAFVYDWHGICCKYLTNREVYVNVSYCPTPTDGFTYRDDGSVPPPMGRVCLVFTDVQNSTHLWEVEETCMARALDLHNALLREEIQRFSGYEVKTEGDAFMVSFSSAVDAVNWCLKVQLELLNLAWPDGLLRHKDCAEISVEADSPRSASDSERSDDQPERRQTTLFKGLRVRMGVHMGTPSCALDPVTSRMDYFGPMVNLAARVSGQSKGGQVLISQTVYQQVYDAELNCIKNACVPAELSFRGLRTFKGISKPIAVYQVYPHALSARDFTTEAAPAPQPLVSVPPERRFSEVLSPTSANNKPDREMNEEEFSDTAVLSDTYTGDPVRCPRSPARSMQHCMSAGSARNGVFAFQNIPSWDIPVRKHLFSHQRSSAVVHATVRRLAGGDDDTYTDVHDRVDALSAKCTALERRHFQSLRAIDELQLLQAGKSRTNAARRRWVAPRVGSHLVDPARLEEYRKFDAIATEREREKADMLSRVAKRMPSNAPLPGFLLPRPRSAVAAVSKRLADIADTVPEDALPLKEPPFLPQTDIDAFEERWTARIDSCDAALSQDDAYFKALARSLREQDKQRARDAELLFSCFD